MSALVRAVRIEWPTGYLIQTDRDTFTILFAILTDGSAADCSVMRPSEIFECVFERRLDNGTVNHSSLAPTLNRFIFTTLS
jgi:hypothetical protein